MGRISRIYPRNHSEMTEHCRHRILVVIGTLNRGGAEMDLLRNLPLIDRSRFEIEVFVIAQRGTLAETMESAGIPVQGHPNTRPRRRFISRFEGIPILWPTLQRFSVILQSTKTTIQLARFIRRHNIDLVHCFLPTSYYLGSIATLFSNRPKLVMSRLSLNFFQDTIFKKYFETRFCHSLVDLAVGNSLAVLEDLRQEGIEEEKLRLLHNGIETQRYVIEHSACFAWRQANKLSQETLIFICVANLHTYKGHTDLLKALAATIEQLPREWCLILVGRDVDGIQQELIHLASELGIVDRVIVLGERDDIPLLLASSDIFVLASHTEGFPNSVLEAMASHLPVIASAIGGIPEMIDHDRNGLLYEAGNIAQLSNAIATLATEPETRERLSTQAHADVLEKFSIERSVEDYNLLYQELIGRTTPRGL